MTVFDVYLNDRKRCRAGVGADGVLSAIVNWVKLTGPAARQARRMKHPLEESRVHVGGLARGSHRSWLEQDLKVGDRVTIAVGKARHADRPRREYPRAPNASDMPRTQLLNVDLDIWSTSPLGSLVNALGPAAFALFEGRAGREYVAHLELSKPSQDANRLIRRFVELVDRLPAREKRIWNRARRRELNVGIQAAAQPRAFELQLSPDTLRAAARVKTGIGLTIYGATSR